MKPSNQTTIKRLHEQSKPPKNNKQQQILKRFHQRKTDKSRKPYFSVILQNRKENDAGVA
jgi:hypothetical protein